MTTRFDLKSIGESPWEYEPSSPPGGHEHTRTGASADALGRAFLDNLFYLQARYPGVATPDDCYRALAYTVRDRLVARFLRSMQAVRKRRTRMVCYLSAEFLLGPHLGANLLNLGIEPHVRAAMRELGLDLDELLEHEEEPGLGNGGLGRLAACYMESLATLQIPATGYGIRYEFGIFNQEIHDGWQVERTDKWLRYGNPWEIARPRNKFDVKLGGHTESYLDERGLYCVRWVPHRVVRGMAYDTPVLGYGVPNISLLRLWSAGAPESFDFAAFNHGDYYRAVEHKVASENLTKVLYPNDEPAAGKRLRLEQQYFLVSCSLQDIVRIHLRDSGEGLDRLHLKYAIQLNDTHPALAIAELMRLLVDEHRLAWDTAWDVTRQTFAYTNHTLLPEALETWPIDLFRSVLPRHIEIIEEIDRRFQDDVRVRFPGDTDRLARMAIVDRSFQQVRMAHLACVGSHAINGVAALHSELLKRQTLRDFHDLWPGKFSNKTNGVTPRRFLALANPPLAALITKCIGDGWLRDLGELRRLEPFADDPDFRSKWVRVKLEAKRTLATEIERRTGIEVDPATMFDVQVKRIHEYKRQHLNALRLIALYQRLKQDSGAEVVPRTVLFAGKAAPGYVMAKLIIKLINSIAEMVNRDPEIRDRLRVVFFPNYNVKSSIRIFPAADLSEQISTAGKEASGTGNMKLAMNGALTIGTLDGANIEIREEVGAENFFLFGCTADEVERLKAGGYWPRGVYESNPRLHAAIDLLASGHFSHGDRELFRPLIDSLLDRDEYCVLADFQAYVDCQEAVAAAYRDTERWTRMSILNVARAGKFSSDRAIAEYCADIWKVAPLPVEAE